MFDICDFNERIVYKICEMFRNLSNNLFKRPFTEVGALEGKTLYPPLHFL